MKTVWLKFAVVLIPILIIGIGFALQQVAFTNTSTIVAGQNIFLTQPTFTAQVCPLDGDVTYKNTGLTPLAWTLNQGGAQVQAFFCIDNQGTSTDLPRVTATGTGITDGACPSTGSALTFAPPSGVPASLPAHTATATEVTITVCAGSNAPAGAGPSFTVTVT